MQQQEVEKLPCTTLKVRISANARKRKKPACTRTQQISRLVPILSADVKLLAALERPHDMAGTITNFYACNFKIFALIKIFGAFMKELIL
jgi:hypothetical protein